MCVDQSYTHCACTFFDDEQLIDFEMYKSDKAKSIYDRAMEIANYIGTFYFKHRPEEIKFEGLAFGMRGDATRDLAGLLFVCITHLKYSHNFHNIRLVSPRTLKKIATGSGKATKKEMIAHLPGEVKNKFVLAGYKQTTGLADLADSYHMIKCSGAVV